MAIVTYNLRIKENIGFAWTQSCTCLVYVRSALDDSSDRGQRSGIGFSAIYVHHCTVCSLIMISVFQSSIMICSLHWSWNNRLQIEYYYSAENLINEIKGSNEFARFQVYFIAVIMNMMKAFYLGYLDVNVSYELIYSLIRIFFTAFLRYLQTAQGEEWARLYEVTYLVYLQFELSD